MNEEIFKAYDIRGVYRKEIDEDAAYKIGRAFLLFLNEDKPHIVVARDGRPSSPALSEALKKGIFDAGGIITDIGLAPTPLLNFTVVKFGYRGGAVVTASHNPVEFNGIKLIKEKALQLYGEDIQKIGKIAKEVREEYKKGKINAKEEGPLPDYLEHVASSVSEIGKLKVVADCANGMGAITAKPFFSRFPAEALFMHEEVDGSFPNHPPDPHNLENIKPLQERVLAEKADLGIFFDGDADRSVLVDEKGEIVSPDLLLALLAKEELSRFPGEKIYYDLRFSKAVGEAIKESGGDPIMMRVGNPFYKEKIILEKGLLGGELSGHIMFRENFGIDDGLFAAAKTMSIISGKKEPLSRLIFPFKKYFQSEEINLRVADKEATMEKVEKHFKNGEKLSIDGLYISYPDWWFNLRKSNTENLIRLRLETGTKELLEEKRKLLMDLIRS